EQDSRHFGTCINAGLPFGHLLARESEPTAGFRPFSIKSYADLARMRVDNPRHFFGYLGPRSAEKTDTCTWQWQSGGPHRKISRNRRKRAFYTNFFYRDAGSARVCPVGNRRLDRG